MTGYPLFWDWKNHPIMSNISGHGDQTKINKERKDNCTKITLLTAASRGILPICPLLTRANISKYVTKTQATHMGHMQRIRQKPEVNQKRGSTVSAKP